MTSIPSTGINPLHTQVLQNLGLDTSTIASIRTAQALSEAAALRTLLPQQEAKVSQLTASVQELNSMLQKGTFPPGMTREMTEEKLDGQLRSLQREMQTLSSWTSRCPMLSRP